MKNENINLSTQGQRLAARVLLIVWLLVNFGSQSALAAPETQPDPHQVPSIDLTLGEASRPTAGAVAAEIPKDKIQKIIAKVKSKQPINVASLQAWFSVTDTKQCFGEFIEVLIQHEFKPNEDGPRDRNQVSLYLATDALEALHEAIKDKNADVRKAGVEVLMRLDAQNAASLKDAGSLSDLYEALINDYWNDRQRAVEALGKIGASSPETSKRAYVEVLCRAIKDQNWYVGQQAVCALEKLFRELSNPEERQQAFDAFIKASDYLKTTEWQVRSEAIYTLRWLTMGSLTPTQVTVMKLALQNAKDKDPQKTVRIMANDTLKMQGASESVPRVFTALQLLRRSA